MEMEPGEVVLRFLESVGRRSEAEFYIQIYRAEPKEEFAAISVDSNVARHATEAVVLDLRFLAALNLFPLVVLGVFEPTDAPEHAARIRRRLERAGVPAQLLEPGDPAAMHAAAAQAARGGAIPIIPFGLGQGATPEERFATLGALVAALRTRKLLFLHRPGGLKQNGQLLSLVNLSTDYDALAMSKELSRKEKAILKESRRLVFERVPHKLVIAVTSPLNLFRELFTVKGAGTLLRRGAVIEKKETLAELDRERLRALLTSSFGRPPREEFFDRPCSPVYLEENYRGAAILIPTPLGMYLTKFAVEREAQGEGIARDLWDAMADRHGTIFWRARRSNPIVDWYVKLADGMARFPEWVVFWRGLDAARIPAAIAFALSEPIDIPWAPAEAAAGGAA